MKQLILIALLLTYSAITISQNIGIGVLDPKSKLDVDGNIQISNASLPMGLMTEVGGFTPILNMSVNFREPNKNNSYKGAAFRIDSRDDIKNKISLFQWIRRDAASTNETLLMALNSTGSLGIGVNGIANIRAKMEINSTTQGFLPPRMTYKQRNGILAPVRGLMIYCTNCGKRGEMEIYNGPYWTDLTGDTANSYSSEPLSIGDYYKGGTLGYILQPGDLGYVAGELHGLVVSPTISTAAPWGCTGHLIGTTTSFGYGQSNTNLILDGCTELGIAARLCSDWTMNGYSDWYLPSDIESDKLYQNKDAIGGYNTNAFYWTSTEFSTVAGNTASARWFGTSTSNAEKPKTDLCFVRAVRSF